MLGKNGNRFAFKCELFIYGWYKEFSRDARDGSQVASSKETLSEVKYVIKQ